MEVEALKDGMGAAAATSTGYALRRTVLLIGARTRAVNMDLASGVPQTRAQNCFLMCTHALLAQTLLCSAIPVVLGGSVVEGGS